MTKKESKPKKISENKSENENVVYETTTKPGDFTIYENEVADKHTIKLIDKNNCPPFKYMTFSEINSAICVVESIIRYYENMAQGNRDISENKAEYELAMNKLKMYRNLQISIIKEADNKLSAYV